VSWCHSWGFSYLELIEFHECIDKCFSSVSCGWYLPSKHHRKASCCLSCFAPFSSLLGLTVRTCVLVYLVMSQRPLRLCPLFFFFLRLSHLSGHVFKFAESSSFKNLLNPCSVDFCFTCVLFSPTISFLQFLFIGILDLVKRNSHTSVPSVWWWPVPQTHLE
jgi:hypothetical protein